MNLNLTFDDLLTTKRLLEAMRPPDWIDYILLSAEPEPNMLRVSYENSWYLIVSKVYFETKIRQEPEISQLIRRQDGSTVIPLGLPVFENDELLRKILESIKTAFY